MGQVRAASLALLAIVGLLALAVLIAFFLPPDQRHTLLVEHGPVETGSVILYLVGAVLLVTSRHFDRKFAYWTAAVLLLCAAREMDVQKAFTSDSITKTRYYIDDSIAPSERIVVAVVVLLLMVLIGRYLLRYWPRLVAGLQAREPFAHSIVAALLLVPLTKLLDGSRRHFKDLTGRSVPDDVRARIGAFEEVLELGIPLLALCAIGQFVLASRRAPARRRGILRAADPDASPRR